MRLGLGLGLGESRVRAETLFQSWPSTTALSVSYASGYKLVAAVQAPYTVVQVVSFLRNPQ